jgi:CheY-specific phosphatase CheX
MPESLPACLEKAVIDAFELMCFMSIETDPEFPVDAGSALACEIGFNGDAAGQLRLEVPDRVALSMASNFVGESERALSRRQVESVVGELTNVICGGLLSLLAPDGSFDLCTPHVHRSEYEDALPLRRAFRADEGIVLISMAIQQAEA